MIFLRIAGAPPRTFYRDAGALPYLAAGEARHELLTSAGTLRSSTDGETSNVTITLRNDAAQCAALFANPPLGADGVVSDESGAILSGIVKSISMTWAPGDGNSGPAGDCQIGVEA